MSDEKCKEKVWQGYHHHRCERNAWRDGYCKQHHPELVKERHAKKQAEYDAKWEDRHYCKWTPQADRPTVAKTQCGKADCINNPNVYGFKYCPYCGKQIKVTP